MEDRLNLNDLMCYLSFTNAQEPDSPATIAAENNEKTFADSESEEASPSVCFPMLPPCLYPLDGTTELAEFGAFAEPTPSISTVFVIETGQSQKKSDSKQESSYNSNNSKLRRVNNLTGRAGKLRCDQCRSWKCEYESVNSPCENCKKKGLKCEQKRSAQDWKLRQQSRGSLPVNSTRRNRSRVDRIDATALIVRQLRPSTHEPLNPFERVYIQSLRQHDALFKFANLQFSRSDGDRLWQIVFQRFGPDLGSGPVRYACVLYSLYKHNESCTDEYYSDYLDRFYRSSSKSITQSDVASLVYGCFAGSMYTARTAGPFKEFENHAGGFSASLSEFASTHPLITHEMFLLECMREKLAWTGAEQFLFKPKWSRDLRDVTDALAPFLHDLGSKADQPQWIQTAALEVQLKIQFIRTIIQLYYHNTHFKGSEIVKESLVKRFSRDFVTKIKPQPNISRDEIVRLRSLLRRLWSKLLEFVSILTYESRLYDLSDQRSVTTILDIYLIIDEIPEPQSLDMSIELRNLIDIVIYTLILVELSTIGLPVEYLSVFDDPRIRLMFWWNVKGDGTTFPYSFDPAFSRVHAHQRASICNISVQEQALLEWVEICSWN